MSFLKEMAGIHAIKGRLRIEARPFATPILVKRFVAKTPNEMDWTAP